jgi:hypothetical protein
MASGSPAAAIPQQVKVPGQLAGPVHDAGHLTDDRDDRAVLIQGPQQRQRIEPDRVIGRRRPGDIVSVLMTEPAPWPPGDRLAQPAYGLFQPPDGSIGDVASTHLSMVPRNHPHR